MREDERKYLEDYNIAKYDRPSVTNDIIIFTMGDTTENNTRKMPKKGLQLLLVKRNEHPFKGEYAIPGGFIKMDEGIEQGALRKLKEKTKIQNVYMEQLYTFGEVDRDIRGRIITVSHLALIRRDELEKPLDENCEWFWIEKKLASEDEEKRCYSLSFKGDKSNVEFSYMIIYYKGESLNCRKNEYILDGECGLAFDHIRIIDYGIERLRNKLEYTSIAFNLLPEFFTVKELQNVYEGIIGREILNFRRKIGELIIETDEKIEGKPFRPAKIYKFNKGYNSSF